MLKLEPETLDTYLLDMLVKPRLPVYLVRVAEKVEIRVGLSAHPIPQRVRLNAFLGELLL